ncbi:MAG: hypothetical protein ACR2KL_13805 [Nocardioidaceae bacterium]
MSSLGGGRSRAGGEAGGAGVRAARRLSSSRWRDPRLAVGVALVAVCTVLGGRLLAASDDTTAVWALRADADAGVALDADLVQVARVHFDDAAVAAEYLPADRSLPPGLLTARAMSSGELVSRSSLVSPAADPVELPVAVTDGARPPDLAVGDFVDVWVTPDSGPPGGARTTSSSAERILAAIRVLDVDSSSAGIGGGGSAVVVLALDEPAARDLGGVLTSLHNGAVVLVRVGS